MKLNFLLFTVIWVSCGTGGVPLVDTYLRWMKSSTLQDVESHHSDAERIIYHALYGPAQNQSYDRLAEFTDTFGSRIAGSRNLENAIDYMVGKLKEDGLDNVHTEDAKVPHWVRGNESAVMISPRYHPMAILGLGSSIATPPEGITADVLVVTSFDDLKAKASQAKGKIIVYNQIYVSYGVSVQYRAFGAREAAKVGGVASLIRSVTPFSIYSPHTGWQDYADNVTKIPTACITIEDAEMMHRMQKRGNKIRVTLKMQAKNLPPSMSRNTVAEIKGSKYPDQVVLVSGHLDSWDVGQGAMDDGGGAFISWQALSIIRQLGLQPKRTIRLVLWTAEEEGGYGSQQYYEKHKDDISNFDMVMESDDGTFMPLGFQFTGKSAARDIIEKTLEPLQKVRSIPLLSGGEGEDIDEWIKGGVPGGSIKTDPDKYFKFHHTNADTMTVQDPIEMNVCAALWTVVAYTVADLEDMLPR
ncbi:carboxypeptidase Q-like [Crassostrea virginica]|uniref:Carboxypeptidase Q n=1 Tax=Crassostrea virginica TaxID=6565 RepID=A0A8B8DV65_CRAVI|nr:carboxypeptidase Q-like [Crassostrea virginica]